MNISITLISLWLIFASAMCLVSHRVDNDLRIGDFIVSLLIIPFLLITVVLAFLSGAFKKLSKVRFWRTDKTKLARED